MKQYIFQKDYTEDLYKRSSRKTLLHIMQISSITMRTQLFLLKLSDEMISLT